ncbi:hypothetical protein PF006_g24643 [Phytophthora fragariae]|uniref:Uncharacterized protein n=1 Tax=Phytophthora fragariae TaxID=53985 RepID=A0A6A3R9L2_9STRA|nr:hypothetical protein PF011_g23156 [Phytophthora fragariae]KAE9092636.1 hypothetical protein PF006_g24643 [Phytophthora fragariae]
MDPTKRRLCCLHAKQCVEIQTQGRALIESLRDHDIRQLEEAVVIPRQLQQADVSAFPGPDRNACANMERVNPHQHSQIVQIGIILLLWGLL